MEKDFQEWHEQKQDIDEHKQRPFFHEGEVWFCTLGVNIGFEQDGRGTKFLRPVAILRKFNKEIFWAIPLTKNQKKGKYYFGFNLNNKISTAILSQIRLADAKRLQYRIGVVGAKDFIDLKKRLRDLLT